MRGVKGGIGEEVGWCHVAQGVWGGGQGGWRRTRGPRGVA